MEQNEPVLAAAVDLMAALKRSLEPAAKRRARVAELQAAEGLSLCDAHLRVHDEEAEAQDRAWRAEDPER
jgi:hypothetical protein